MTYHFFFKTSSPFSNWHPSKFYYRGVEYCCGEQYMMAHKALVFNDLWNHGLIMNTNNPREHKRLGRKVRNYNEQVWVSVREQIVFTGCWHKFNQNGHLKEAMLRVKDEDKLLVEASPYDRVWGIGFSEEDALLEKNRSEWGQNLLGNILTEIMCGL